MLAIYLLTHNRPKQVMEAINSILAQTDRRFRLVVSDNSSTDELRFLIGSSSELLYIKRPEVLSTIAHANAILSEISSDYFTLFHDDDLMLPNYVANFWKAQALFPDAAAFGTNAKVELHGRFTGLSFRSARSYVGPINSDNLLRRYFSHHQLGIAPLPSYIYRADSLRDLWFDAAGGKYTDVQWLSKCAGRGPVIWIAEPMMVYRLHESNDGIIESRHDRLRFLAFLKASGDVFSPEILSDYRNFLYKKLLPSLSGNERQHAYETLSQFIDSHRYQRLCRLSFYGALIKKLTTRFFLRYCKKV